LRPARRGEARSLEKSALAQHSRVNALDRRARMRQEVPPMSLARQRVLVAMSGGVDSSLAAALLAEQGHEVIGVTLHLWDASGDDKVGRCCAPEDRDDARRTCELLGVPHYVIDEREAFRKHVVDPFIEINRAGKTPIPCVACNQEVKLTRLWQLGQSFGATAFATGHYARATRDAAGVTQLLRGRDLDKDQSYFLYGVPQSVLANLMLPLGELLKTESREHAKRLGLPNWNKPDSQELCFVPDGNVRGFVQRHGGESLSGDIVDEQGAVLGKHAGLEGYTIGQRRGLGIPGQEPRYVLRVIAETRQVVVGTAAQLEHNELSAANVRWTAGVAPAAAFAAQVRIRSRHLPAAAEVTPTADGFHARFCEPQSAIAPGQAAVVYAGDLVIGGGYIS
jgi:tRNA-specific 2-thiouridylase